MDNLKVGDKVIVHIKTTRIPDGTIGYILEVRRTTYTVGFTDWKMGWNSDKARSILARELGIKSGWYVRKEHVEKFPTAYNDLRTKDHNGGAKQ